MTDLHDADARPGGQIDRLGWIFAAAVVAITAIAGIVAYQGSGATTSSPTPVVAAR